MQNEAKARLLVTLQFVLLFLLLISATRSRNTSYLPAFTVLMFLGLASLGFAYIALRPSLRISPIPKDGGEFISHGIYRFVRHPMYLGLLLIGFSLAIKADNLIAWLTYLILISALNFKASFEDKLLRELHPESVHYQIHTSKILPCLGGSCRDNCANS